MSMELIITVIVLLLALVVLNAILLGVIYFMRRKAAQVSGWPSTQGVVTSSSVESRPSDDGYTDYPSVRYSYQVGGQAYKGSVIAPGMSVGGSGARKVAERYAMGAPVTVYYNPQNPADAVLEQKAPSITLLWIILIVFDIALCGAIPLVLWGFGSGG